MFLDFPGDVAEHISNSALIMTIFIIIIIITGIIIVVSLLQCIIQYIAQADIYKYMTSDQSQCTDSLMSSFLKSQNEWADVLIILAFKLEMNRKIIKEYKKII